MNAVMIMSGGVGSRFGAVIPKQYNMIGGEPVIDYVIDAVLESKLTDKVVVVMDPQWIDYSEKIKESSFEIAVNGQVRLESVYNGMKLIREKYACDKLVIVDAVAPFVYADLIDDYFRKLDQYDAVITAQKITGGLADVDNVCYNRNRFIVTQSPEGFRFELLWNHFQKDYPYQEIAGMLPADAQRYYNYDFKNNLKITYDFELAYAEFMLSQLGKINRRGNIAFFDKDILVTEGIKSYLLRNYREQTMRWLDEIYGAMPSLISRWELTSFLPNQVSRFGLVLQGTSKKYGEVVVKFIPEIVGRYERELEAMHLLPASYMCTLLDEAREYRCMLLGKIKPARYGLFEENLKLTKMFRHVVADATPYSKELGITHIPFYIDELKEKMNHLDEMPYCREEIEPLLHKAQEQYQSVFGDAPLYVIHGDLHEQNVLDDGKRFWGIDPCGFIAPIEFECVRFIRNDVRNHPSFGYKERLDILLRSFSRFVSNTDKLVKAFLIDMAFITFNSVFENESPAETLTNLAVIAAAEEWGKYNR